MNLLALLQGKGGLVAYLPLMLLILAILLFGIATFWRSPSPPPNWNKLVAGGLFCCALYAFIIAVGGLM